MFPYKIQNTKYKIQKALFISLFVVLSIFITKEADAGIITKSPAYLGLSRGLVGCWNFDGDYTKAQDCSGYNSTGTINGPTNILGKVGQALNFDGVDDYVDLGARERLNLASANAFTLSAWVYLTGSATQENGIISEDYNWVGGAGDVQYELGLDMDQLAVNGQSRLAVGFFNGSWNTIRESFPLAPNVWHHVIGTWDGTNLRLYKNGVNTVSGTPGGSLPNTDFDNIYIGRRHDDTGPEDHFPGKIDETRIYNRALSPTEIQRLYLIGLGSKANRSSNDSLKHGLVGCWTFDGDYTKVPDCSGRENVGTINGATRTTGKIGQAMSFDGVDDNVDIDRPFYSANPNMTVSFWVKSTDTNGAVYAEGIAGIDSRGFELVSPNSNKLRVLIRNTSGGAQLAAVSTSTVFDGNWHHVAFSDSSGTAVLYVDGVRDATNFNYTRANVPAHDSSNIGCVQEIACNDILSGIVDEVRIYNRALSSTEVQRLYQQTQSKYNASNIDTLKQGLVGCWTFDGDYTKAPDCSGNNNVGTLTNGPVRTVGKTGQAINFDGINDYVNMGDVLDFEQDQKFSFSVWVRLPSATPANSDTILSKVESVTLVGYQISIRGDTAGDPVEIELRGPASTFLGLVTSAQTWTTGWTHLVWTYDGTNTPAGMKLYRDGVSQSMITTTNDLSGSLLNTGSFQVGVINDTISPFLGSVDDVRAYNRVLSAGEINKLYQMGR